MDHPPRLFAAALYCVLLRAPLMSPRNIATMTRLDDRPNWLWAISAPRSRAELVRGSEGADEGGDQLIHSRSQSVASGRGRKQARRSASVASSVDASVSARPTKRQRR